MKRFNLGLIAVLIMAIGIIFFMQSCKKENMVDSLSQTNGVPLKGVPDCDAMVEDGILNFRSMEDFYKYHEYVNKLSQEELKQFEKQNNYMSYENKTLNLLVSYKDLCEDSTNFTTQKMQNFRNNAKKYILFTDTNYVMTIEGLVNKVVNPEGYLVIDSNIYKYEGLMKYKTHIDNKELLEQSNFTSSKVTSIEIVKSSKNTNNPARNVLMWGGVSFPIETHQCKRKRRSNVSIVHYTDVEWGLQPLTNPTAPWFRWRAFISGFKFRVDNYQRGWTGFWYSFPLSISHQGNYHGSGQQYINFNDFWSVHHYVDKLYQVRRHVEYYTDYGPLPRRNDIIWWAGQWVQENNPWEYIQGTVGSDQCGWKYHTY